MPTAVTSLTSKLDEFLINAGKSWKLMKEVKEKVEPFSKANDAFEIANRAMSGELTAYSPGVEKVRVYVANQKDKLAELARQDENYWMERSGANVLDPVAMMKAKNAVDEWTKNFSQLKYVMQQFLPVVQSAQSLVSNTGVVAVHSALEESSLPALDGIALSQVIGDLNNSVRSIDLILQRLRNCRLAMR